MFSCGVAAGGPPRRTSALALLVAGGFADHHYGAVATDHLALVTDGLDARLDLHEEVLSGIGCLLVAVDDPAASEVVRRELHHHTVLGEDPDVVLTHLAADVSENLVAVAELHPEHRVRESLDDGALDLDHAFFLRHVLHNLLVGCLPFGALSRDRAPGRWPGNLRPRTLLEEEPGATGGPRAAARWTSIPGARPTRSGERSGVILAAARHHEADTRWGDTPV